MADVGCSPDERGAVDGDDEAISGMSVELSLPQIGGVDPAFCWLFGRWFDEDSSVGSGIEVLGDSLSGLYNFHCRSCDPSSQFRGSEGNVGSCRSCDE